MLLSFQATAQDTVWVRKCAPANKETYSVCFSSDGSKILSGSEHNSSYLRLFQSGSGNLTWDYELSSTMMCVSGVRLSSDGTRAAAIEEMGNLLIFDHSGTTPVLTNTISTGTYGAFALDFSSDGTRIATACTDKLVNIYSVSDGALLHSFTAHDTWAMAVDWSTDGRYIVTGGNDKMVKIWDSTGALLRTLSGHTDAVLTVRFSVDGNYIVSGSKDDKIKVWDAATGNLIRTLNGHSSDVLQVDISDDNQFIASGSADSYIKLWNFNTGTQQKSFRLSGAGKVYSVDISPDGKYVAAGTSNGDVQLWDIAKTTSVSALNSSSTTFNVYPNPCNERLNVSANEVPQSVQLLDIRGVVVTSLSGSAKNTTIPMANLPASIYTVVLTMKDGTKVINKIVKQ